MMRSSDVVRNPAKLQELVLYIAQCCETDPAFGRTKLYKLLFFCDFLAFGRLGCPITGERYIRLDKGPVPDSIDHVVTELRVNRRAAEVARSYHTYTQYKLLAIDQPDLSSFSGQEIALVDGVIREYWGVNATQISELSHLMPGWELVDDRETIPYSSVYLSTQPPTDEDLEIGYQVAVEHGLVATKTAD